MTIAPARLALLTSLIEQGATAADIAAALDVTERRARDILARAGLEPAPALRGRPPGPPPDVTIRWRVPAAVYQALVDYADRHGGEIVDAIADNLVGQCWDCGEVAILDARDRPLCEACVERTGRTEALTDEEEERARDGED